MRILFLGGIQSSSLSEWLQLQGEEILHIEEKFDLDFVKGFAPDIIISYNYKYILPSEIIQYPEHGCINLHVSLLPWNRGAYPNVWSFIEDTPKGVTAHYIDEGIDTGDIIIQKEVFIDENKETLKSSYNILHREILELFEENWGEIKSDNLIPKKQKGKGSIHFKRDYSQFEPFIKEKGWDTTIKYLKKECGKHRFIK